MKNKKLNDLIRQRKNKYFRDYYKNNKETVLQTQKRYWQRKIEKENNN